MREVRAMNSMPGSNRDGTIRRNQTDEILKPGKRQMRNTTLLFILVPLIGLIAAGCGSTSKNKNAKGDSTVITSGKGERKVLYWYDPMSPTTHFDHAGKSPMMDMDLVPKYADEDESLNGSPRGNPNIIKVDPAMVQNIGVVTAPAEYRKLTRTINAYGVVAPDEKEMSDINTRVSGWIEQLYFDYTGMNVDKGQPMAVIYSPDLIAAEQEFLQSVNFAEASSTGGTAGGNSVAQSNNLVISARERLAFFGMSDKQIDELQSTGRVIEKVVIHSPSDGVILEKDVFEGQKISAGQTLFRVANLHRVWILADVFKIDMPFLKSGSPAAIEYDNSQSYEGRVDFIYPEVDPTARSVTARISLSNPRMMMKVGQYVNVAIHSPISYNGLAVPAQAVINTGLRQVVAVALGKGRFEIRDVKLGVYADGYYEITGGLETGETIVTSGQFLIDSDANLKNAGASLMASTSGMNAGNGGTEQGTWHTQSQGIENIPGMKMNVPQKKAVPKKKIVTPKKNSLDGMDMNVPGMNMGGKKDPIKTPTTSLRGKIDTTGQEN